ncbi:uncharacterized protein STEHIDRAFT_156959 [Stereum hirsutum FP-91666 SS1]|uniref:uncharacterized protein n=1 Tax=Stereum hirsutum (strain FP-91666) TaxID=721885 RepID=UPI000440E84B|nr:uncharacterized protein STEHIDRAFT_156959 [Stereum hirsutum FP-91666 SS1]EIM86656.1 hypothetical protein STEHIDRAFT_156959 [Stereum hirsutum FP-91666 SS1]
MQGTCHDQMRDLRTCKAARLTRVILGIFTTLISGVFALSPQPQSSSSPPPLPVMDNVGNAANIAALVSLPQLITPIIKYCLDVAGAERDSIRLKESLEAWTPLINTTKLWVERCEDMPEPVSSGTVQTMQNALSQCEAWLQPVYETIQKTKTLRGRLQWPFSTADVNKLVDKLEKQKLILVLALNLDLSERQAFGNVLQRVSLQALHDKVHGALEEFNLTHRNTVAIRELLENNLAIFAANQAKEAIDQNIGAIINWLYPLDFATKLQTTLAQRHTDTCRWFLEDARFTHWRNSPSSVLWLHGIPGSGKTVLTSTAVDHLKQSGGNDELVAYAYFDFRDSRSTDPVAVFRTVFAQLIRTIAKASEGLFNELSEMCHDGISPPSTIPALRELIRRAANSTSMPRILVVIDALDECNPEERHKILQHVPKLATEDNISVFVSSRKEEDIRFHLSSVTSISLNEEIRVIQDDIRKHIVTEISNRANLADLSKRRKKQIRDTLLSKSQGMFRWVECQLDYMNTLSRLSDLLMALGSLPKGLHETYERILERIINDKRKESRVVAQRVLGWIIGAHRPLTLTEVEEAIKIEEFLLSHHLEHTTLRDYFFGSLSTLQKQQGLAVFTYLLHRSLEQPLDVDEFPDDSGACEIGNEDWDDDDSSDDRRIIWTEEVDSSETDSDEGNHSHTTGGGGQLVRHRKVQYGDVGNGDIREEEDDEGGAGHGVKGIDDSDDDVDWDNRWDNDSDNDYDLPGRPFLSYAAFSWHLYVAACEDDTPGRELILLLDKFLFHPTFSTRLHLCQRIARAHFDYLVIDRDREISSPFTWPLAYGSHFVITQLLRRNPELLRQELHQLGKPLMVAAQYGNLEAIEALMSMGAEITDYAPSIHLVDVVRPHYQLPPTYPPVTVALRFNQFHAAEMLLRSIDLKNEPSFVAEHTALHSAVRANRPDTILVMISRGANVNIRAWNGGTPLHYACSIPASPDCVRTLVEAGANVNTPSFNGTTPLSQAVRSQSIIIVQYLLDNQARADEAGFISDEEISWAKDEPWYTDVYSASRTHSANRRTYYSPGDILDIARSLRRLPKHLIRAIFDIAECWVCLHEERNDLVEVTEVSEDEPYLSLPIVGQQDYPLREVRFKTMSHDQGWMSFYEELQGTYHGSYTWFDAGVDTGTISLPRRRIQVNIAGSSTTRTHTNIWSYKDRSPDSLQWFNSVSSGSVLSVIPKALYSGWKNYVVSVSVEVFTAFF